LRNHWIEELFSGLSRDPGFQALARNVSPDSDLLVDQVLRVSGLTLTARAIYLALLFRTSGRHLIVVADGNKQAESLHTALRTFCELLNAATVPMLLPALDVLPGQAMSPHAEILASRAQTLGELARGTPGIVVMPVAAALTRVNRAEFYRQLALVLRVREEIPLDDLAAHLESVGYEKREPVEMAGEYSIRGGILDVFPPGGDQPVRVEFFGDEIESIRRFDPASQRSIHKLNECTLEPFTEFQKSRATLRDLSERMHEHGTRSRDLLHPV